MLYSDLQKEHPGAYDVVICGGGLAGLMMARQLKLTFPDIELLLLEKRTFPLPEEKFKVGESTVEASAFYLGETLKLQDYFKNNQFTKLGFRYFTGDSSKNLNERPEIGLSQFAAYDTFQINRPLLETDLFTMNELAGIQQFTNIMVQDIIIGKNKCHQIKFKDVGTGEEKEAYAKWVIDAMGRRCLIQRKHDTHVKATNAHSSSWFWIKDRIDIDDIVSRSHKG
ncbi:MAG: NAD(P)/FAD-dependent oxidoreductase, partial [Bacteroidota bacterium]